MESSENGKQRSPGTTLSVHRFAHEKRSTNYTGRYETKLLARVTIGM